MTAMELDTLAAAFCAGTLPRAQWTHVAHLRVGAWHVHHAGAAAALALLRQCIRALNDRHGTPNSPTSGYHETITVAYVRLIDDFLRACDSAMPLERRVEALITGALGDRSILFTYWTQDALMSARARAEWVPPDIAPLALPEGALRS